MNLQLLIALQEFVQEVKESTSCTESHQLWCKADELDSILHATIESENARILTFNSNMSR